MSEIRKIAANLRDTEFLEDLLDAFVDRGLGSLPGRETTIQQVSRIGGRRVAVIADNARYARRRTRADAPEASPALAVQAPRRLRAGAAPTHLSS